MNPTRYWVGGAPWVRSGGLRAASEAGSYDEAAEPLATARQLVKRSPAYHMLRGMIAVAKEQFLEAIPHFDAALDLAPA